MDKEVFIKEELETVEEEWDIKGEIDQPLETQFCDVKKTDSSWIEEDENIPLTYQPSWKREIEDDDEQVNEELEQKFVCGFPSNVAKVSSEELTAKESNPLLIDRSTTSSNQSCFSENSTELQPLIVQDTSQDENSGLTNQRLAERRPPFRRCPVCKEVFTSIEDAKNHAEDHGENWPYTCFECNRVFVHTTSFHSHMCTQHRVNRPHVCKVCKMTFKDVLEFRNHKLNHIKEKSYSCSICNKGFTRNYDRLLHLKQLHGVLRPYKCSACKETFRLRWDLQRHMLGHDGKRRKKGEFICDICGRPFAQRVTLIRHLATHSNDRPYSCTICNKSFKSKSYLSIHTMWHTSERRYTCTTCGQVFLSTPYLKKHMLLHSRGQHSGDWGNVCGVCGKSYRRNFYLRQHKLTHEKDLPSFATIEITK